MGKIPFPPFKNWVDDFPQVFIDIADLAKSRHLPQDQRIENYRSPDPIGVLHVTLLGATALPAADFGFAGGSSDPYVVVKIGSKSWQSLRRMKTLNPKWGRWVFLHNVGHTCLQKHAHKRTLYTDIYKIRQEKTRLYRLD